jgi:transglutaminase-like putative cysteine protease/predicted glutamine amidotransferase
MPNLLAMSFEGELAPSFDLRCLGPGAKLPDGWGLAYYPAGEPCAQVLKEPAPAHGSIRGELVRAWQHLESSLFIVHVRTATWGRNTDANTQPFVKSHGGRDFTIAHGGSLDRRFTPSEPRIYEPVGATDTELVFCELLNRAQAAGKSSLADIGPELLHAWLFELNAYGSLSLVLTDGHDLIAYADASAQGALHVLELLPPYDQVSIGDADVSVDLTKRGVVSRKGIVVSSAPLDVSIGEGRVAPAWRTLEPGSLLVVRQGARRAEIAGSGSSPRHLGSARPPARRLVAAEPKRLHVTHRTTYRYERAVERSTHTLRLEPFDDRLQRVRSHDLTVSVDGSVREFDDVFGNRVKKIALDTPFTELEVVAKSVVDLYDTDPLGFAAARKRTTIPLVWMPWQHHMLQPFLLPRELPESQLVALAQYAMSFVERNDYDVLDTLLDLNRSIFREYAYRPGETTLYTTPFDVYAKRRGVCQDFANLFIALCRLLGVPARYVCGYVFTGPQHANVRMGEASHAWVQVYLPEVGWRGFDPTNGTVTQTEHVRVSVGRSYVDATPTSGTLYVGGAGETLEVEVRVDEEPMPG